jgi:hypothetical protein
MSPPDAPPAPTGSLPRFQPMIAETISATPAKTPARGRGNVLVCVSSGCQTAMKSPPGPNLQSGSICPLGLGFISISSLISTTYRRSSISSGLYRQSTRNHPNKNRTKIRGFPSFLYPSDARPDSRKDMGLRGRKFLVVLKVRYGASCAGAGQWVSVKNALQ